MVIKIPTSKRKYFRQALEIIRAIPPLNKIRPKELDVLAQLLFYNYLYKDIDESLRGKIVFDYDTKIEIRDYLSINETSFNNILTTLRKRGVLTKRSITNTYGLTPDNPNITFTFKFEIDEKGYTNK